MTPEWHWWLDIVVGLIFGGACTRYLLSRIDEVEDRMNRKLIEPRASVGGPYRTMSDECTNCAPDIELPPDTSDYLRRALDDVIRKMEQLDPEDAGFRLTYAVLLQDRTELIQQLAFKKITDLAG